MQASGQTDTSSSAAPLNPPNRRVYDLRNGEKSSDAFYAVLGVFADQTLAAIERRAAPLLDAYVNHIQTFLAEAPRSRGEYAIEFLTLGMVLRRYEGAAEKTPRWIAEIARQLTSARERSLKAKPVVDWVRAGIARYSLAAHVGRKARKHGSAIERVSRLIDWMNATGEFKQEAMRLNNWRSFLAELRPEKATYWLHAAIELLQAFERDADTALGAYTRGVAEYVAREHSRWRWREDLLMCGKPAVEYHLNMLAAEVMNRGLREDFVRTKERVVLLPACMRGWRSRTCKAHIDGVDITCAACDPDCAVNRITREMRPHGIRVYIVPHISGFSRWLSRWQHTGAGVTAVACILNILPGGFEMRARGIHSQCMALDFPGCRKHWDAKGFPTAVNADRLIRIAAAPQA